MGITYVYNCCVVLEIRYLLGVVGLVTPKFASSMLQLDCRMRAEHQIQSPYGPDMPRKTAGPTAVSVNPPSSLLDLLTLTPHIIQGYGRRDCGRRRNKW